MAYIFLCIFFSVFYIKVARIKFDFLIIFLFVLVISTSLSHKECIEVIQFSQKKSLKLKIRKKY